ncbi:hypothetical protein APED_31780 [Acanthopleuribacter pedis]
MAEKVTNIIKRKQTLTKIRFHTQRPRKRLNKKIHPARFACRKHTHSHTIKPKKHDKSEGFWLKIWSEMV